MIIFRQKLPSNISKEELIAAKKLSEKAWSYPGKVLFEKWFYGSNLISLVFEDNSLIGFACGTFIDKNIINLTVTIIDPAYRNQGLASKLNKVILRNFLLQKKQNWEPLYITFRTMSPDLYKRFYSKVSECFPDYKNKIRSTTKGEKVVFQKTTKYFGQEFQCDAEKFIIKGATRNFPQLNYRKDRIPWSGVYAIDNMFKDQLKIMECTGDAYVVVGTLGPLMRKLYTFILRYFDA